MARYYFHLHQGDRSFHDPDGLELADLDLTRMAALKNVRAIICEDVTTGVVDLDDRLEVVDGDGASVLVLRFDEAVEIRGPGRRGRDPG